jgi:hypothetical protein
MFELCSSMKIMEITRVLSSLQTDGSKLSLWLLRRSMRGIVLLLKRRRREWLDLNREKSRELLLGQDGEVVPTDRPPDFDAEIRRVEMVSEEFSVATKYRRIILFDGQRIV